MVASIADGSKTITKAKGFVSLDAVRITTNNHCLLEVVPSHGGVCNRLVFAYDGNTIDVIAGLDSKEALDADGAFRGIPLFPVVNRLDGGKFEFDGQNYQLEVNETALNNALHGFLHHLRPICTAQEFGDRAVLSSQYNYDGSLPGYPFQAAITMDYELSSEGALRLEFTIENTGSTDMPFGFGWHPYFKLGSGKVDDLELKLPKVEQVKVNERMLPTGETEKFENFAERRQIGSQNFDTCFKIVDDKAANCLASTVLWSPDKNVGLELTQPVGDELFSYMQVCIDSTRESIAIEPVSCNINALNSGEGLTILAPGAKCSAHYEVKLIRSI